MSSIVSPSRDLFACNSRQVKVLLPLPLAGCYTYRLPPGLDVATGDFVLVPLGNRKMVGVIWGDGDTSMLDPAKLKDVESRLPLPAMPEENRQFIDRLAHYNMAAPGAVLKMAMSAREAFDPPGKEIQYQIRPNPPAFKQTKARLKVTGFMASSPPLPAALIARETGVSASVIKGLAKAGILESREINAETYWPTPDAEAAGKALSPPQTRAAKTLSDAMRAGTFSVNLLDGVTGSGKTEVYFETIRHCLQAGKQALILLPEISLSSQWLSRFKKRFGCPPGLWHSDLATARRRDTWRAVQNGRIQILVGARSALHLPFENLGLIIVDEEHEQAFKQEDGVIYHARDMAVVRARICDCPIVLVSATPSLETMVNAAQGRYRHLILDQRHGRATLPTVKIIDLRQDTPGRQQWISSELALAVREKLKNGEQAMLFLNRRGYAPLTLCSRCGHRLQCPQCTAWLVEHRFNRRLMCHHCGYSRTIPDKCPACEESDSFRACGPGVERLAEEALRLFPEARMEIATSDTLNGPAAAADFVDRIVGHKSNLIIGTQIIAKGYHFPMLTLVGIIDADLGLTGGDLRAAERSFQLLHQVAGRAGRADHPGQVYIQTSHPDAPVITALARHDRDGFMQAEIAQREMFQAPPFGRWAALIISGFNHAQVEEVTRQLSQTAPFGDLFQILGPVEAPLAMLRGKHRRRFLLKCARRLSPQKIIQDWLKKSRRPAAVRVAIDIDPYSFM